LGNRPRDFARIHQLPRLNDSFRYRHATARFFYVARKNEGMLEGVRIYHIPRYVQDVLVVKPGTLDDTSWLRPSHFVWMKSAQGWVPIPGGVKALEGQT